MRIVRGWPAVTARSCATVQQYIIFVRPVLRDWSARHDHLREITREDIVAALDERHGYRRINVVAGLRRLFAFCHKNRVVFRDPTRGIKAGKHPYRIFEPLDQAELDQVVETATIPVARLALVLAAIHAARPKTFRKMRIDDIDRPGQPATDRRTHAPIDAMTHRILSEWLDHRRTRWPNTANPHLIINQHTAMGTGPGAELWGSKEMRGHAVTLERLRIDRQLEEALRHWPDPLHLATVFGLDPETAIRYAENARTLLATTAEKQNPQDGAANGTPTHATRPEPKDRTSHNRRRSFNSR